jgi:hypothetical protein
MFNPDFKQARNEFLRKHRLILGWHNGIVAFLGFVFAAGCGGLLAVPNALTSPEIGLFSSIEYALAVGVFLMFVGVWGVCAVVRSSRYLLTLHSVVMMVVAVMELLAGLVLVGSGDALESYMAGGAAAGVLPAHLLDFFNASKVQRGKRDPTARKRERKRETMGCAVCHEPEKERDYGLCRVP